MHRLALTVSVLALLLSACADSTEPEIDVDVSDEPTAEADPDSDDDGPDDATGDDGPADDAADGTGDEADGAGDEADGAGDGDATEDDADEGSPTPDPAAMEDPCADHQDRAGEAFLELVAPVDDQQADGQVELVGCASVSEGTIQYRVLDGDGVTLEEGFTTAECGGPCIGEFRESIVLDAAAEPVVHVQVFWEDLSDGSERDLVERIVVLG